MILTGVVFKKQRSRICDNIEDKGGDLLRILNADGVVTEGKRCSLK